MTIELTEEEKAMTLEEFEDQQEKVVRPPDVQDENGNWVCGECKARHLDSCKVYQQFRRWHEKLFQENEKAQNQPRPEWMCSGCDEPKEGPHRFSCYASETKANQLAISATQKEDGTFMTHLSGTDLSLKG